jgi:hypothetical protein
MVSPISFMQTVNSLLNTKILNFVVWMKSALMRMLKFARLQFAAITKYFQEMVANATHVSDSLDLMKIKQNAFVMNVLLKRDITQMVLVVVNSVRSLKIFQTRWINACRLNVEICSISKMMVLATNVLTIRDQK